MISERVKEYAKRERAVALDMMSDGNERFHAFDFSQLPNGETAYLCIMIVTESEKQGFVDRLGGLMTQELVQ